MLLGFVGPQLNDRVWAFVPTSFLGWSQNFALGANQLIPESRAQKSVQQSVSPTIFKTDSQGPLILLNLVCST